MGSFCDFWENKILDHLFGKGNYTPPTIYVALSITVPTDAGGNVTEPSENGYERKATIAADWNVAVNGLIDNANDLAFPEATGPWGTVTHFVLYDALTGGNALAWGALGASKTIDSGETTRFAPGDLDTSLD